MFDAPASLQAAVDATSKATATRDTGLLKKVAQQDAIIVDYLGPYIQIGAPVPFFGAVAASEVDDNMSETALLTVTEKMSPDATDEKNLLSKDCTNQLQPAQLPDGIVASRQNCSVMLEQNGETFWRAFMN